MNVFQEMTHNEALAVMLRGMRNGATVTPDLAIAAADSPAVKASAMEVAIDGRIVAKAAQATISLASLDDVAAGGSLAVFFAMTPSGVVSLLPVTPAADGSVTVPDPGEGKALWGALKLHNGTASDFEWGTTHLDAADVEVSYLDLFGAVPGEALWKV